MQLNHTGNGIWHTYDPPLNDPHDQTLMTHTDDHATSTITDFP